MTLRLSQKNIGILDHKKLISFLEVNKWEKIGDVRGIAEVWSDGSIKLVIPTRKGLADYRQRLYETTIFLSDKYGVMPDRFVDSLSNRSSPSSVLEKYTSFDVISFRIVERDTVDGSIPLTKALSTIEKIRQSIYSAARSAVDPKAYYVNKGSKPVENYMRGVRLGQTSEGSYVINVISPVEVPKENIMLESVTFERRIVERIYTTLGIIEEIRDNKIDLVSIRSIYDVVSQGLSANFCEGISGLISDNETVVEIGFKWGDSPPDRKTRKFSIDSALDESLKKTYEVLKKTANLDEQKIRGGVESLNRKRGEEVGKVGIATLIEGRPAHIYIDLGGRDYENAVEAHNKNLNVSFLGKLIKSGNRYTVENPKSFVVDEVRRLL